MTEATQATPNTPVERDEYTAKQIATRIGADPKVLRKFFRSAASSVEPVGQGGRYVFDAADLPKIKEEFDKWNSNKKPRGGSTKGPKTTGRSAPKHAEVIEEDEEIMELEDDEEPTDEEIMELDDEELDDILDEDDEDED